MRLRLSLVGAVPVPKGAKREPSIARVVDEIKSDETCDHKESISENHRRELRLPRFGVLADPAPCTHPIPTSSPPAVRCIHWECNFSSLDPPSRAPGRSLTHSMHTVCTLRAAPSWHPGSGTTDPAYKCTYPPNLKATRRRRIGALWMCACQVQRPQSYSSASRSASTRESSNAYMGCEHTHVGRVRTESRRRGRPAVHGPRLTRDPCAVGSAQRHCDCHSMADYRPSMRIHALTGRSGGAMVPDGSVNTAE